MGQDCQACNAGQKQAFDLPTIKNIQILEQYKELKKKHGNSQLKPYNLQNGQHFLGTIDPNNKKQGYGQTRRGDFLYAGHFKDDIPYGQGILVNEDNQYYNGQFQNGKMNGIGKQCKKHFSFKGQYKQGVRVKGELTHPKYVYNGQFKNNLFHGTGSIHYLHNQPKNQQQKILTNNGTSKVENSNVKYVGEFQNGKFHGKGKLSLKQNATYEGSFKQGLYHGYGVYKYPNNSEYHGNYQNGKKHGYGRLLIDGTQFAGQWKNGQRHGKAIITKSKDTAFGEWKTNQLFQNH